MLSENLKMLRQNKQMSQEELSVQLNVVRQTISKWENGISVPDADMLIRISEFFDVPVSDLLGKSVEKEDDVNEIAIQLAHLNRQLSLKNKRTKRVMTIIKGILIGLLVFLLLSIVVGVIANRSYSEPKATVEQVVEL